MSVSLVVKYDALATGSKESRGKTLKNKIEDVTGKKAAAATYGKGGRSLRFIFRSFDDAKVPRVRVCQILKKAGHEYSTEIVGNVTK